MEDLTKHFLPIPTITITALLLITILFKLKLQQVNKSTTPPSPPYNLPFIGHLPYLLLTQDMPHLTFAKLARSLGPIFRLQMGRVPTVVVSSAHFAQLILKAHDHVFSNRPPLLAAQILSFGCSDVTFSPYGPYWRHSRKICVSELLSVRRVSAFHRIRLDEVSRLVSSLSTRSGSEVDLSRKLFELSNDVLCRVAFGRRFNEQDGLVRGGLVKVLTETQALLAGFCVGDFFPGWEWVNVVSGMKRRLLGNLEELRKVCDVIIDEHLRKESDSGDEDFVDVLLRVQKREDLDLKITDDNLKALILDMFVAGTDTTAATLEWIMTELVRHPTVLARAQEEVHAVVSTAGCVSLSHLQTLHYMKCVIKETMRLHPPVPLLVPRESMDDCTLDGYFIPKKTRILINSYAIGRNPESWVNALEFDPCRFLGTDIEVKDRDFRFLPFGGGRRGCPGYAFGLATVELTLANLLYHFNWALPSNASADSVDLDEIFGLATKKKNPLILVPTVSCST
uniref:Cytochrome P450 n=1 Tax=Kalanchoe fedtschenkoi TaxID=63787 RepID=A0A7N0VJ70_KALFE